MSAIFEGSASFKIKWNKQEYNLYYQCFGQIKRFGNEVRHKVWINGFSDLIVVKKSKIETDN